MRRTGSGMLSIVLIVILAIIAFRLYFPNGISVPTVPGSAGAAIQYADTHWNCVDPACTSTVQAGDAQPDFQCAEFVSRSLSADGLIPGLNQDSSQAAFGNYVAHNGQTYDLLWVGWTSASGYNTGTNGVYQYLTDNGIGFDIGNNPSGAVPGDVVIYHEGDGHTSLLVQTGTTVDGNNSLIDVHNNAAYHVPYTEGYPSVTILHIPRLSSSTSSSPMTSWGSNRLDIVAIGTNNAIYHDSWYGSGWRGWQDLGVVSALLIPILSWSPGGLIAWMSSWWGLTGRFPWDSTQDDQTYTQAWAWMVVPSALAALENAAPRYPRSPMSLPDRADNENRLE